VVHEGDKLAAVIPAGKLRVVANFDPPAALGRIRAGQHARLRLEGFPWAQYGSVTATVTNVASEIRDGSIRVEMALDANSGSRIPLQHGLPARLRCRLRPFRQRVWCCARREFAGWPQKQPHNLSAVTPQ